MSKPPEIILIGPSGEGSGRTFLVAKLLEQKEFLGDNGVVTVKVIGQEKEDTISNVERALVTNLQQYIEINFNPRGKIFKYGGQGELMLVDDYDGDGRIQYKKKRKGRFGGTNFTPKKKKRKR